jgi:hypothetical protein
VPIPKGTQVNMRTAPLPGPDAVRETGQRRHDRSPYVFVISSQNSLSYLPTEYNPRYFEDPAKYKPSRWYGLPADSELFTAFSVGELLLLWPPDCSVSEKNPPKGPRACIGRRFATVEATCFLAFLLRDWKVLPILRDGESKEQWESRIMDGRIMITLGVKDIPVRLVKRNRA